MAINVKISQETRKRKINIKEFVKTSGLSYGIIDNNYTLTENTIDTYTLLYDESNLARGIEVSIDENQNILLRLNLPTSIFEIELFYNFISKICKRLKLNVFEREQTLVNIKDIDLFIEVDKNTSIMALRDLNDKVIKEKLYDNIVIFGIKNPITLGIRELNVIGDDLKDFSTFLNELQKKDILYVTPKVYKKIDNSLYGVYFVKKDITSVVPNNPYIINMDLNNELEVKDWYVIFPGNKIINYDDFITNVKEIDNYDANHIIINLSSEDIEELIKKYSIEK